MQSVQRSGVDGVLSLDQAARSLLVHQAGGVPREPDPAAMKTKVRRLYDICNVLTSLKMIEKVRLAQSSKPAFRWLGVTEATQPNPIPNPNPNPNPNPDPNPNPKPNPNPNPNPSPSPNPNQA